MAQFRPAGFSDSDSDDDYGFYDPPTRKYPVYTDDTKKKLELLLQDAIMQGNITEVEQILNKELNGNSNTKLESNWTPLMHSCFHAQDNIVKFFLDSGADPNLHSDSVTPLMTVCSNNSASDDSILNILDNLIEKGSILNVGDKYGQTPLMRAIASGRVAVVQKLLENNVNFEMRDQQGWTAIFWAVYHNKRDILEILIECGSRLTEVDKYSRTLIDIAQSHDYEDIIEVLKKHITTDEADDVNTVPTNNQIYSWHDFYPGLEMEKKITYTSEIPHLLYGMSCERLTNDILNSNIDLRTFLLMEDEDMEKIGIDLPFERQRLKYGLRNFHSKGWKLNAVAGLYARKAKNYSTLDCLVTLGTHLQQIYILEATIQYALRDYVKVENKLKFEPPDSPTILKLKTEVSKIKKHIYCIRKEIKNLRVLLNKISRNNPPPADMIKVKSMCDQAYSIGSKVVIVCSVGLLVYHSRSIFFNVLKLK